MPGFVHGKKGEEKWDKSKRAASHAGMKKGSESYWRFANWFFHHSGKSKKK